MNCSEELILSASEEKYSMVKGKAVSQHAYGGAGGRGGIAPTHSPPRH
jgi:hypothetical protein